MKPNKTRIRLWVRALRSGKYKQTRGRLRRKLSHGWGYCCLGVACEVYSKQNKKRVWNGIDAGGVLPVSVQNWFGFSKRDPELSNTSAVQLNDHIGKSFTEISNRIEKQFLK